MKIKYISLGFLILIQSILIHGATPSHKCLFNYTVDLTNLTKFENGSYLYQDILIPEDQQEFYNYRLLFLSKKEHVQLHLRGCACTKKPCVRACCNADQFFNSTSFQCENLNGITFSPEINIFTQNESMQQVNFFSFFTYQVGLPCAKPEALDMEHDKWDLYDDGILFMSAEGVPLTTNDYCFSPYFANETKKYAFTPFSCPMKFEVGWELYLNTYGMAVSVLFLIPTILVYLCIKELRCNLRGKLLICYLTSLSIGYGIIGFVNISGLRFSLNPCMIVGFSCYFFFMSAFLWLSVLCFDIWCNFKETYFEFNSKKNLIRFIYYSIYAWGTSLAMTFISWRIELSESISESLKPGVGVQYCWLDTTKWSAGIYFYGPNLIILIFNFITFTILTMKIYKIRSNIHKLSNKDKFLQENALVILRLFLIMGISWIFDILSYCMRDYKDWSFLFIGSDFCNAIQGVLIFVVFVFKQNVLQLLSQKFAKMPNFCGIIRQQTAGSSLIASPTVTTNISTAAVSTVNFQKVASDDYS